MRSILIWNDKIPDKNGEKIVINDISFKPDGSQLIAAVGTRVLIYDTANGSLLHALKGHKDTAYTVDYSYDGKRFASGGADNIVIIWTDKAEGILKYTHTESIQKLAYSPNSQCLASCTGIDFGLWSPDQKSVSKYKVNSKILCVAWTNDGQYLTLGMFNGQVSIRNKQGIEKTLIERNGPIWSIAWNPSRSENIDILVIASWDKTLSFYQQNGTQQGKERKLKFYPCSVNYYNNGQFMLVAGSDKKSSIYTKDGIYLSTICESTGWIWCTKNRPKSNFIAIGTDDGTISMYNLTFLTVHGIYKERYAYRENMTDVIVQHLMTDQKVRIKTRDKVLKLGVYKDRLAVQLSDRIIIYELSQDNTTDMQYRLREKINKNLPCSLLVVTSLHFILCHEKKLQQYNFNGKKEREWILESSIRYIKVIGGAKGKEGLLIGLKSGSVFQIFIDNPFPIPLVKHKNPIRCLDLSSNHEKLAVVDEKDCCQIYDLITKESIYEEKDVNCVAWNTEFDDMVCFSGKGLLKIKSGSFPPHIQNIKGHVVGFTGSKVFCLDSQSVQTIDIPQSFAMYRYLQDQKTSNIIMAYTIACLGVTENDWRYLGWEALKNMNFIIARKSFLRSRDIKYIELVNLLESNKKQLEAMNTTTNNTITTENNITNQMEKLILAEISAYQGKFEQASKYFIQAGYIDKAINMFTDLRMWEDARKIAGKNNTMDTKKLIIQQAQWAEEVQDWRAAAEMYSACGNYHKAAKILGEQEWYDDLAEMSLKIESTEKDILIFIAQYLLNAGNYKRCRDIYLKTEDYESLLKMHIKLKEWDEAIRLTNKYDGKLKTNMYIPYAEWLISQDRFDDAIEAYNKANHFNKCIQLLDNLSKNAINENRFKDAAYYYWQLAEQMMRRIKNHYKNLSQEENELIEKMNENTKISEIYYAYSFIYGYTDDPFTTALPETLFHASCYLLNILNNKTFLFNNKLIGISKSKIYYTLAKHSEMLGAFKLARLAYNKLEELVLPTIWIEQIDISMMILQTKPYIDKEELLPVDYRSGTSNPLINPLNNGDICINSGHPFIRSSSSFENLPLVEFQPIESITDEEAVELIRLGNFNQNYLNKKDGWKENNDNKNVQTLQLDEEDTNNDYINDSNNDNDSYPINNNNNKDLFEELINKHHNKSNNKYEPIRVNEKILSSFDPRHVFIIKYPTKGIKYKYYKSMIPDIRIHYSSTCRKFFNEVEFEFEYLKEGICPFCRNKEEKLDE